jgi:GNAT superfamily N-acetyltransferase
VHVNHRRFRVAGEIYLSTINLLERRSDILICDTDQVDFSDLPPDLIRRLPPRDLPVGVLAWLGVDRDEQGQGLGSRLLAQALRDCYEAGRTFAVVAVILDCIDDDAKAFYRRWDLRDLPGHCNRLYLSWRQLELMMTGS